MSDNTANSRRARARFSPGPWWGFNGVDELTVDDRVFSRGHIQLLAGRVINTYGLHEIELLGSHKRPGRKNQPDGWTQMTLKIRGRTLTFTGHPFDGDPFVEALREALSKC